MLLGDGQGVFQRRAALPGRPHADKIITMPDVGCKKGEAYRREAAADFKAIAKRFEPLLFWSYVRHGSTFRFQADRQKKSWLDHPARITAMKESFGCPYGESNPGFSLERATS